MSKIIPTTDITAVSPKGTEITDSYERIMGKCMIQFFLDQHGKRHMEHLNGTDVDWNNAEQVNASDGSPVYLDENGDQFSEKTLIFLPNANHLFWGPIHDGYTIHPMGDGRWLPWLPGSTPNEFYPCGAPGASPYEAWGTCAVHWMEKLADRCTGFDHWRGPGTAADFHKQFEDEVACVLDDPARWRAFCQRHINNPDRIVKQGMSIVRSWLSRRYSKPSRTTLHKASEDAARYARYEEYRRSAHEHGECTVTFEQFCKDEDRVGVVNITGDERPVDIWTGGGVITETPAAGLALLREPPTEMRMLSHDELAKAQGFEMHGPGAPAHPNTANCTARCDNDVPAEVIEMDMIGVGDQVSDGKITLDFGKSTVDGSDIHIAVGLEEAAFLAGRIFDILGRADGGDVEHIGTVEEQMNRDLAIINAGGDPETDFTPRPGTVEAMRRTRQEFNRDNVPPEALALTPFEQHDLTDSDTVHFYEVAGQPCVIVEDRNIDATRFIWRFDSPEFLATDTLAAAEVNLFEHMTNDEADYHAERFLMAEGLHQ